MEHPGTGGADVAGPPLRSYAWACRTRGVLTEAQRSAVRAGIRAGYLDVVRGVLGWPFRRSAASVPATPPDSKLARVAEEAAAEQGPALAGHGARTWILGSALATHDRVRVDPELLYVASLLHDAGMMREVVGEDFTVRSGELLLDVAARAGAPAGVGTTLADAAVAHATPGLSPADDPVGYYVQVGAMADLAGLRMWDLPRGLLREAYRAHPGQGVHRAIPEMIRGEAIRVPEGRFAMLRRSGMDRMVEFSPTRRYAGRPISS